MTDTSKTRLQLCAMAADELLVGGGSGGSPEDEDIQKIDSRFNVVMGELSTRGVVTIADEDEIPIEWCGPLAELLANECARAFGRQRMSPEARSEVEDRLKIMTQNSPSANKTLKTDGSLPNGSPYGLSLARWARGG